MNDEPNSGSVTTQVGPAPRSSAEQTRESQDAELLAGVVAEPDFTAQVPAWVEAEVRRRLEREQCSAQRSAAERVGPGEHAVPLRTALHGGNPAPSTPIGPARSSGPTQGRPAESRDGNVAEAESYANSTDRLWNDNEFEALPGDPQYLRVREKPIHRLMILLAAQGLSYAAIARRTHYSTAAVAQVLRQPWARAKIVEEVRELGRDEVTELLKGATLDSLYTLIEVRDSPLARQSDRVNAANILIQQYLGRPVQRIDQHVTNEPNAADVVALEAELAKLQEEEKRLRGN